MDIFKIFKKKEIQPLQIVEPLHPLQPLQPDLFTCHHCSHRFEVTNKMIFPTSVRLLYKEQYVTGKGVMCPQCKQNSIFG